MYNTDKFRQILYEIEHKQNRVKRLRQALTLGNPSQRITIHDGYEEISVDISPDVARPFFEAEIARLEKELAAIPLQITADLLTQETA